jgi:parallel beta-helix repeat protein
MRYLTLSILLVGTLLVGIGAAGALPPGGTFVDDDGSVHEGYIEAIAAAGITRGCNPTGDRYCPDETVTRGQMAAFLVRALGLTSTGGRDWFTDDDGSVFEGDINKLAAAGVTAGCNPPSNDRFCPDSQVSRGQMAAFLSRAYKLGSSGGDRFVDDDGSQFEGVIEAIAAAGITVGCNPPTNTRYCPDDPVRRDAMASFIGRAEGLQPVSVSPRVDLGDVDVEVYPGESLADLARNYPSGTVFLVHGVQHGQSVQPKDNQAFLSAGDAVMDGDGWASIAFGGDAQGVTVIGFEVTNYANPVQQGAISGNGGGWVIESNNVHHNATAGIRVQGDSPVVRNNNIHHNGQLGVAAAYTTNGVIQGNEIGYNNWQGDYSYEWEAGGSKFWSNTNLTLKGNYVHDNYGPGLWCDTNNYNTLYEDNVIDDNYTAGILHEVSYDAVMRNNTVRGNGFGHAAWLWGGGIMISSSKNIEVYGNRVEGNHNAITAVQQSRYDQPADFGPYLVANIHVHNNTIVDSGQTGIATDTGDGSIWDAGHRFDDNTYIGDVAWAWGGSTVSWSSWRGYGHDAGGSYNP